MDTKGQEEGVWGTLHSKLPRTRESYDWGQVWLHMFPSQYVFYDSRRGQGVIVGNSPGGRSIVSIV